MQTSDVLNSPLTTSDKIRRLSEAGYERAEIARLLGKRYQHVRNVLEGDRLRGAPRREPQAAATVAGSSRVVRLETDPEGRLVIPAELMARFGVAGGEAVVIDVEADSLTVMNRGAALARARETVRRFIPAGVSLADDLIQSRRAEDASERG